MPTKEDLLSHLDKQRGDCPKQPMECIFQSVGCNLEDAKFFDDHDYTNTRNQATIAVQKMETNKLTTIVSPILTRENLNEHMSRSSNYHLSLIHNFYNRELNQMKAKLESIEVTSASEKSEAQSNTNPVNYSTGLFAHSKNSGIGSLLCQDESNMDLTRIQHDTHKSKSLSKISEHKVATTAEASGESGDALLNKFDVRLDQTYHHFSEKIDILESNQKGLINDLTRVTKNNDKLKQENNALKENIKEYKTMCQDLHQVLALTQVSLLKLKERLINQEKLSHNGNLLWKITNVHERIHEAMSGGQTSQYSPSFYMDPYGRVRFNENGDLMLNCDFGCTKTISFTLIDQLEAKEHVIDVFKPDPNSSPFRRPISEMNIALGLPVFCPLGKLLSREHEYIKDNTMFIEICFLWKDVRCLVRLVRFRFSIQIRFNNSLFILKILILIQASDQVLTKIRN